MEFHYHKPQTQQPQTQRALNPAQTYPPYPPQGQQSAAAPVQQNPSYAPVQQQHPVTMGQVAPNTNETSKWRTAALWIGGVVAATVISYYVQKALRAQEEYRARNRNPDGDGGGGGDSDAKKKEEIRFVLPNDGSSDVLSEIQKGQRRLAERLEDLEHHVVSGGSRGNLRGK